MVVVPAFSECNQRKEEIISAIIAGVISLRSIDMRQGIDRAGSVNQRDGRDKESPNQHLRTIGTQARCIGFQQPAQTEHRKPRDSGNEDIKAIEEPQFRVLRKVRNPFEARRKMRLRGEPPDMRPQKAILPGRVDVVCCIRCNMVMAMVTGPPKWPPLGTRSA